LKVRSSIVFKLNLRLISRLFGIFLAIDLFLCAAAAVSVIAYAERTGARAAELADAYGPPQEFLQKWLFVSGCTVLPLDEAPDGIKVPGVLQRFMPPSTASGVRSLNVSSAPGASFSEKLRNLSYHIAVGSDEGYYDVAVSLGQAAVICRNVLLLLFVIQLVMLLNSIFSGARIIRITLRPIAELAETAKSLNRAEGAFSPEKMEALAGKLDGINASRLDTRISVDGTQAELKNLAEAINGMLDRINGAYRSQVRFVSDASHELRTPIAVIQGYANLLDRWGKNDEKTLQESIDAIKEEASNMKALIEQLLFLARGDNNTMALRMERFDLGELASEVLRETQMIDAGHEYGSRITPVFIYADKALMKQALRILTDNAIKYTEAGGHIAVSVAEEGGFARLTVQDDGIGIPPEAVPQIFDRFYRADESRARSTGGAGLGLSIAKWISERHRGHMEVLSRKDVGTRISVVIPLSEAEEKPRESDQNL